VNELFGRAARWTARATGHPIAFVLAVALIIVWAISGPIFGFSDTWQLVINTGTTIATFLMVFLIQNTQNRDTEALQLKLAELIRVQTGAHNALLDLENLSEDELEQVRQRYEALAKEARKQLEKGTPDTDQPDVTEPFVEAEQVAAEAGAKAKAVASRRRRRAGR
jgi:low affinity Fe/Cu permease